ncbi:MAG: DUF1501 domain-containing protein [Pseudomonadota bacterium]|jgi:hypothetical protein|nr:MAG: DUF1501 domain-containing protein [Pseudomonadota bacterium]
MSKYSRRDFLRNAGGGLGAFTVGGLIGSTGVFSSLQAAELEATHPLAPKQPHFTPKAKSVIWLHMIGAPATQDLFDYKPLLDKLHGQEVPQSFLQGIQTSTQGGVGKLLGSHREWKQYGESGSWFSDFLPHLAQHADELAYIHSSVTVGATHDISVIKLNTGALTPGRPALGAWIQYALGSANPNLPGYLVLSNGGRGLESGSVNYSSGFLPAVYSGVPLALGEEPILYLDRPSLMTAKQQRQDLDFLRRFNDYHASRYPTDSEIRARTEAYELAERMQATVPQVLDLGRESEATRRLYGLDDEYTRDYGTNLLRARRLVENGVRFVHVVSGMADGEKDWDAHDDLITNHTKQARMVDKPVAALLTDLKARGMLDSTLVVWTSEFGRTSYGESGSGRDHNPWGYTQWLAGGGVKGGVHYGQTDEIGLQNADEATAVDTYDIHATVLNQLGLDHLRVTYLNQGRSERPTVVYGRVVKEILA